MQHARSNIARKGSILCTKLITCNYLKCPNPGSNIERKVSQLRTTLIVSGSFAGNLNPEVILSRSFASTLTSGAIKDERIPSPGLGLTRISSNAARQGSNFFAKPIPSRPLTPSLLFFTKQFKIEANRPSPVSQPGAGSNATRKGQTFTKPTASTPPQKNEFLQVRSGDTYIFIYQVFCSG